MLKSTNWKERLEGMEQLQSRVQDLKENADAPILIQVCSHCILYVQVFQQWLRAALSSSYLRQLIRGPLTVQGLSHLPGWGEKNFQVLGKAFEIVKQLAQLETGLGKKDAFVAITGLVAKLSDGKLKGSACEALSALSEAVGPQFVCAQLHKQASSQKNPKVRLSMPLSSVHLSHWAPLHLCRSVHVATPPVFDVILGFCATSHRCSVRPWGGCPLLSRSLG